MERGLAGLVLSTERCPFSSGQTAGRGRGKHVYHLPPLQTCTGDAARGQAPSAHDHFLYALTSWTWCRQDTEMDWDCPCLQQCWV